MSAQRRIRPAGTALPEVTPSMQAKAREVYELNLKYNAIKGEHDKARKALLVEMQTAGLKTFNVDTNYGGGTTTLEVEVATPERTVIDVDKLWEKAGKAKFMLMVNATKEAVTNVAGKMVATMCEKTVPGTTNVNVKPAKK